MSKVAAGLESAFNAAPPFQIEILTARELSLVTGGGPFYEDNGMDCTSGSVCMCHVDGVNEGD